MVSFDYLIVPGRSEEGIKEYRKRFDLIFERAKRQDGRERGFEPPTPWSRTQG
jgi:hypothetical protein